MDPFVFVPAYRVVICRVCRFACVANEVSTHLRTRHRDISPRKRQSIIEAVQQIRNIIRSQAELSEFQLPAPNTEPIRFLEPPKFDGLKCLLCPYVSRHLQKIQAHCRSRHGWKNQRKRGRLTVAQSLSGCDVLWTSGVTCQRFFKSRAASGWFEVGRPKQVMNEGIEPEFGCSPFLSIEHCQAPLILQEEDFWACENAFIGAGDKTGLCEGTLESKPFVTTNSSMEYPTMDSMNWEIWSEESPAMDCISSSCFLSADFAFGQNIPLNHQPGQSTVFC